MASEQRLTQAENVHCVDVLYVDYGEERLDVVEDVECPQIGCVECVDVLSK